MAHELVAPTVSAAAIARQDVEGALRSCDSRAAGLTAAEATERLAQQGPNRLPRPRRTPWYVDLSRQFVHLLALLLWGGAALAWVAGMPELSWAILAVILINGLFSFWQQYKAERAVEALEALLPTQVTVRRDGQPRIVDAAEVVSGDVLLVSEGDAVPADARLISAVRLRVDLSALTGESRPSPRHARPLTREALAPAEQANLVFAGTNVVEGRGEAVVFATARRTEFGRIAKLTEFTHPRPSPIECELIRITRLITVLSLTMGLGCFAVGTALGRLTWVQGFLFGVGILVANVPEGLLPTLTLSLAYGVRRMADRRAVVKRLAKVEALGATTVIVTDKTGTLTENQMTVRALWRDDAEWEVTGVGYEPAGEIRPCDPSGSPDSVNEMLLVAALCCDARLAPPEAPQGVWRIHGDPTEGAILVAARKAGFDEAALAARPRLAELPFDSVRKRMTTIQRLDGRAVACVKGAPSEILGRCRRQHGAFGDTPWDAAARERAQQANDRLARRGLRVLAVAKRSVAEPAESDENHWQVDETETELTFLGLLAMEDPPRPETPAAVAACREAGIRVLMATGDSGLTGAAIGREIGLLGESCRTVTGAELEALSDDGVEQLLHGEDVLFARVAPQHKLRLVEALQRRGEVVAVTGDGVNDAPALKRADVGVAMGLCGTEVARQAADVVLTDDNFATIVAAIEEGRAVFANVRKFLTYILASNVPEIVPFVAMVLWDIPLPLTVMQVLAVDLGTDLLPALALGAEPPEADVMRRPPRRRHERLLDGRTLLRAYFWLGVIEAALSLLAYFASQWWSGWRPGQPLFGDGLDYRQATTMSLAAIVACQIGNVLACRSDRRSAFAPSGGRNWLIAWGIAAELAILAALIDTPWLSAAFGLAPLDARRWALLLTFPGVLWGLEELRKWRWRRWHL